MKKYLVLAGAMVLVLAMVSPSTAQYYPIPGSGTTMTGKETAVPQFQSWGHLEVFTWWSQKMETFGIDARAGNTSGLAFTGVPANATSDNKQAISFRYRQFFSYGDSKTVRAVIGYEVDSVAFGEPGGAAATGASGTTGSYAIGNLGGPTTANKTHAGVYGTDQISLEVKWGFLEFVVPNTPVSIRAGLQNWTIGGSIGRFWMQNDAPGILAAVDFAPHRIEAFYWKFNKQNFFLGDNDNDMYGVRYLLRQPMFNIEAWFGYQRDRRTQVESWAWTPIATGSTVLGLTQSFTPKGFNTEPWWLGINAPFKFGNWAVDPTFIYLGGKAVDWRDTPTATTPLASTLGTQNRDFDAWLADLAVTYRLGPGLSFTGEAYYATGLDNRKNDKVGLYAFAGAGGGVLTTGASATDLPFVFGSGKSVFFFGNADFGYYSYRNQLNGGLWYLRANAEYSPLTWLNLGFNYFYIRDNSLGNNNGLLINTPSGSQQVVDKNGVGHEINMIATINIYKNFRYMVGFGYFIPGDVYDQYNSIGAKTQDAKDAWNLLTNLRYAF